MLHLAIPMWIEAAHAYRERVVTSLDQFDLAMEGGLGYQSEAGWLAFFDRLGSDRIVDFIGHHKATSKSLQIARDLIDSLRQTHPRDALAAFAA